jgi:hypothetical protein
VSDANHSAPHQTVPLARLALNGFYDLSDLHLGRGEIVAPFNDVPHSGATGLFVRLRQAAIREDSVNEFPFGEEQVLWWQ